MATLFDLATVLDAQSAPQPHTVAHTCSGTNRVLIVDVLSVGSPALTPTSVTYAAEVLDLEVSLTRHNNPDIRISRWTLVGPPLGTHDVVVTFGAAAGASVLAHSYNGALQAPLAADSLADTNSSPSLAIGSEVGALVADVVVALAGIVHTVGAGQTRRAATANDATVAGHGTVETEPGAATVTMSRGLDSVSGWAMIVTSIPPAPSGQTIAPGGIASTEAWGAPTVTVGGGQTIAPSGIASTEVWGTPAVSLAGGGGQTVAPGGIASTQAWGTPTVSLAGGGGPGPPPEIGLTPTVTATAFSSAFVGGTLLDESWERSWRHPLSDAGSGSVKLQNDDADMAACVLGNIVRFELAGAPVFAMVVERHDVAAIAAGEEADEATIVSGRGTMALWQQMVVYPEVALTTEPFWDNRRFDFTSALLSDAAWPAAIVTPTEVDGAGDCIISCHPPNWPDPTAEHIWDRLAGSAVSVPVGTVFFRKSFSVAVDTPVELRAAADDAYEVYVDGVPIVADGPVYLGQSKSSRFRLSAGTHLIAVRATNANALKASMVLTVMTIGADGNPGTVVVNSGADWKCLGYPASPPGFTPGYIIRRLLTEAQARGVLTGMMTSFTDSADSAGALWPTTADVAFRVGLDGLAMLAQLAETYIETEMSPTSLTLHAWVRGTKGAASAVALARGVNLMSLSHTVTA